MAPTRSSPARPRAVSTASPASVRRHVALSIVAVDRTDNGYFRAKLAQEKLIEAYIPYTIIRATQFMEFLGGIADSSAGGKSVGLPPVLLQPIAAGYRRRGEWSSRLSSPLPRV